MGQRAPLLSASGPDLLRTDRAFRHSTTGPGRILARALAVPWTRAVALPIEVATDVAVTDNAVMEVILGEVRVRLGPGFDAGALRRGVALILITPPALPFEAAAA